MIILRCDVNLGSLEKQLCVCKTPKHAYTYHPIQFKARMNTRGNKTQLKDKLKWHDWSNKCILVAHKVMLTCQTLTSRFKLHIFREHFLTVLTIKYEVWHL